MIRSASSFPTIGDSSRQTKLVGDSLAGLRVLKPNPGPQTEFLSTPADVAFYGGAAGAGKTLALLMEPMRHVGLPGFTCVIFRETYPQIKNPGGLWDVAGQLYPKLGGVPNQAELCYTFPSSAKISFRHLGRDDNKQEWDGAQVALIEFDQLEHFSAERFFYLLGRNRTSCGVRAYLRASANPNPDSFLRWFLAWYIDESSGLAIPERSGKIRFFTTIEGKVEWGDSREELVERFPDRLGPSPLFPLGRPDLVKSFTFIPGKLTDNPPLMRDNPGYEASLNAMRKVDRERLLEGNWNVRDCAGSFFKRESFMPLIEANQVPGPNSWDDAIRYWDRAATPEGPGSEAASYTCGTKLVKLGGTYFVADVIRFQAGPSEVRRRIRKVAEADGIECQVGIEQDPGQAGVVEAKDLAAILDGFDVVINTVRENKGLRATPVAAQAEAGNVRVVRAQWNEPWFVELENFDGTQTATRKTDQADSLSGAHSVLSQKMYVGVLK